MCSFQLRGIVGADGARGPLVAVQPYGHQTRSQSPSLRMWNREDSPPQISGPANKNLSFV